MCRRAPTFERLKGRYLGREKGLLPALFAKLKELPPAERGRLRQALNAAKVEIEEGIGRLSQAVEAREAASTRRRGGRRRHAAGPPPARRAASTRSRSCGARSRTSSCGWAIRSPTARRSRTTSTTSRRSTSRRSTRRGTRRTRCCSTASAVSPLLLRTHTSPVQIREMRRHGAPLRIIVPGRVYRKDEVDATHSPVFHQVEGLVVDRGISMADLKGTVSVFLEELFGKGTKTRFIPTFFPFVEPGVDVAMSCIFCRGAGCAKCKGSGWIEIMGAGMVHPRVLQGVAIDPEEYTGFAFGLGIDRVALAEVRLPGPAPALRRRRAFPASVRGARVKFSLDWLGDFVDVDAAGGAEGVRRLLDQAGIPLESVTAAGEDTILDAEITPNRPDAMGHRGLAREIAAMARPADEGRRRAVRRASDRGRGDRAVWPRSSSRCRGSAGASGRASSGGSATRPPVSSCAGGFPRSARSRSRPRSTPRTTFSGTRASRSTPSTTTRSRGSSSSSARPRGARSSSRSTASSERSILRTSSSRTPSARSRSPGSWAGSTPP